MLETIKTMVEARNKYEETKEALETMAEDRLKEGGIQRSKRPGCQSSTAHEFSKIKALRELNLSSYGMTTMGLGLAVRKRAQFNTACILWTK